MFGLTHDPPGKPPDHEMKPVLLRGRSYDGEPNEPESFETQPAGYSLENIQGRQTREETPLNVNENTAGKEYAAEKSFRFRVRYDGV